ncbi:flagellar basal body L-ring protein FlgH [Pseudomarimonas salicorniae]|uniref:Flagellar L-ring protein n=1 Tax=Pseudomarimonas salicorniae TaxID=2933270 RepID=A0ABT0GKX5_9GAMM|nr:flagellar basal body L-ring protein FlgH [Lysobacter sp. CAU 1642]MCK7595165.1 flagellar basal body L-ring protein FlgH [Lysobacter sp. CAU 1642]
MTRPLLIALLLALAGCAAAPRPDPAFSPLSASAIPRPAPATDGAIYREGSGGLALFSDQRARFPGDLITITLSERTVAQTSSTTNTSRSTELEMAAPNVLGAPVTINGRNPLTTSIGSDNTFSGAGSSNKSMSLTGSVTVTVVDKLPNGNLLVRGEKLLRLNRSDEVVQIQGIVRPADIQPDNSIPSSRVADARIVYTGRGEMGQANAQSWLSRFFAVVMP